MMKAKSNKIKKQSEKYRFLLKCFKRRNKGYHSIENNIGDMINVFIFRNFFFNLHCNFSHHMCLLSTVFDKNSIKF